MFTPNAAEKSIDAHSAGPESTHLTRSRCLLHTEGHCDIFLTNHEQRDHTGSSCQDRDWNTKARVIPKTNLDVIARRFDHDHVRDRTNDGEISRERGRQCEYFPHQHRLDKVRDPAPASAVHARFSPARKQAKIDTNTAQTMANKPTSSLG